MAKPVTELNPFDDLRLAIADSLAECPLQRQVRAEFAGAAKVRNPPTLTVTAKRPGDALRSASACHETAAAPSANGE